MVRQTDRHTEFKANQKRLKGKCKESLGTQKSSSEEKLETSWWVWTGMPNCSQLPDD